MKKRNLFLILPAVVALCSCGTSDPSTSTSSQESSFNNYIQADANSYKTNFNTLRRAAGYHCEANQAGDVGVLAIPVDFNDYAYQADHLPLGAEGSREAIRVSLFGDPVNNEADRDRLYSHSLKSFYKESSFGKCKMDGVVLPWFHTNMTVNEFDKPGAGQANVHNVVIQQAMDWLRGETEDGKVPAYGTDGPEVLASMGFDRNGDGVCDLKDFDSNGDGFVDLVTCVYSCPVGQVMHRDTDTFWAWTTQFQRDPDKYPGDPENPKFSRFWWSSYDFMYDSGYYDKEGIHHKWTQDDKVKDRVKFSANTFIHESGHGLGLPDYYSYDNKESPLGGLDMMDYNIGDHNAVSKSIYKWTAPKVVTGDADIVLHATETTGECVLVPIRKVEAKYDEETGGMVNKPVDWKNDVNTLLDEYLMLEFVTGKGVARYDSVQNYYSPDKRDLYYNEPGVRIMHADLRIGAFSMTNEGYKFDQYITKDTVNAGFMAKFAHDNTPSRTVNGNALLEIVRPADNEVGGVRNVTETANNEFLFRTGNHLNDFQMNTGIPDAPTKDIKYTLGYNITIDKINGSDDVLVKFRVCEGR